MINLNAMMLSGVFKSSFKSDKQNKQYRMDIFVAVFQNNYSAILKFLPQSQHHKIKQSICRGVYYLTITSDIWLGLKEEVVDKKMENFEHIQFIEEDTKVVSKQQKQIRIHSLKKNNPNIRTRQASNVKQKKLALNTINSQLPFRSTEIGFKRLLKTNTSSKQKITSIKQGELYSIDLVQIPKQWTNKDLLINVKQPWSLNVQRASNLCFVVKRWNQFHHRTISQLKSAEKDLSNLVKKCINIDKQLSQYLQYFQGQPYSSLRQLLTGCQKQLLIDEQLNKLGNVYITNHNQLISIGKSLQPFISKTHDVLIKLSKLHSNEKQSTWVVQYLSTLQQLIEQYLKISLNSPKLLSLVSRSILEIMDNLLEEFNRFQVQVGSEVVEVSSVGLCHISKRSDFFEVLFQSLQNCFGGALRMGEKGEQEVMGMSLTMGKFKNLKAISHNLWNIAKYFSKLSKQLQSKQKKGSNLKQTTIIRNFISSYQDKRTALLQWKNPQRVEKQVAQLKQSVNNLKGMIQAQ